MKLRRNMSCVTHTPAINRLRYLCLHNYTEAPTCDDIEGRNTLMQKPHGYFFRVGVSVHGFLFGQCVI
jgi:hypothetical protein